MFPLWWVNKKVNKLWFSDFLTGRTTKSLAITLNRIFIHVRFFVRTCKIGMFEQSGEHYYLPGNSTAGRACGDGPAASPWQPCPHQNE